MEILGRYKFVLFGWQAMQGATNYTHTLSAQIEQARRVKARYPSMPTAIYRPAAAHVLNKTYEHPYPFIGSP